MADFPKFHLSEEPTLPSFIINLPDAKGVNMDALLTEYYKNNKRLIISGEAAEIYRETMLHVINTETTSGYNEADEGSKLNIPYGRGQYITNSTIQESYLSTVPGFIRQSKGIWLTTDGPEVGSDFIFKSKTMGNVTIEAKCYQSVETMLKAKPSSFHNAQWVACYIIGQADHWKWLQKTALGYRVYDGPKNELTELSKYFCRLPLCWCKEESGNIYFYENKKYNP
jgi:hypothetical protein